VKNKKVKLALNKTTVANLNDEEMRKLRGGKTVFTIVSTVPDCATKPSVPDSDCPGCAPSNPTKDPVTPTE
jgi:natural product precursor